MTLAILLDAQEETLLREGATRTGKGPEELAEELLRAQILLQPVSSREPGDMEALAEAVARMSFRSPDALAQARAVMERTIRPGKPLPPGKSVLDMVAGQWPGTESDEEVEAALQKLS